MRERKRETERESERRDRPTNGGIQENQQKLYTAQLRTPVKGKTHSKQTRGT